MGSRWARVFAEPKQSSWYQWHEVQWWGGLVDVVTLGVGVLACLRLFLALLFRNRERERGEGGARVGQKVEKRRDICVLKVEQEMEGKVTVTEWIV